MKHAAPRMLPVSLPSGGLWDARWERLPMAAYACDSVGRIAGFNARAAKLWGREPRLGELFCGSHRLYLTERAIRHDQSPVAGLLRSGVPIEGAEMTIERPDGSCSIVRVHSDPIRDDSGHIVGALTCLDDITDLKRSQEMLAAREAFYRDLLDALPAAIYTTDNDGRITFYNRAAVEFSGREPTLGDPWCVTWRLYHPDGTALPHDRCPMAVALKEQRPVRGAEAVAERPDGARIPFLPYPTPLRDSRGAMVGAVNMLVDITERKRAETQQRALLDEINHRVKNTLVTVQALANLTFRDAQIPPHISEAFLARLMALSSVHNQLAREQWEAADLRAVLVDIFTPYQDERWERVRLDGPAVRVPAKVGLTLALVLHELATNAVKYGALSQPGGMLSVSWSVAANGQRLRIDWRETGGPAVRPPERRGFGTQLLERSITRELRGTVDLSFAPTGVGCSMDIPLASR